MPLTTGDRLGSYEVVSPLGAGGMGEVYRARDTKLGRDVAIKILPASFVHDPDRVARFQREAQMLAALNHPHIAAIYGLEDSGATQFLVLELVEGETLASKLEGLTAGGLGLDQTLAIARQVADALEAAHEKGIIHRDLKPANIAITHDGDVKVLDFGLAKALEANARPELTHSPTLTFAATQAGVILGTAAYMSPEQAKGRTADKRADIWAFGCVLYEMLTGRRAFDGEDVSEVIAAVIRGEPDWTALPPNTPEQIRLLLKRCLEKDRKARISDIGTARFLMTETIAPASPVSVSSQPAQADRRRSVAIGTAIGLIAGIIIATLAARTILRSTSAPWPKPARFAIGLPPGSLQVLQAADRNLDISADGAFIVYRGAGATQAQLFVRAVNELDARPLSRAVEGRSPFISPDGRWVGFFAGPELKKVLITGGPAITLCRVLSIIRGASWGPDDTIVFADINSGLMSVPASGGEPRVLIKPAADEGNYNFPFVLPGGAVLFSISTPGGLENSQIAVFNPKTGERRVLLGGGTAAQYGGGYLVYGADSTLRAVRFDVDRLAVLSDPVPVVEQVMTANSGAMNFAMSTTGSLVYLPTSAAMPATPRSLVWVTRQGREQPIDLPPRAYADPRISPDGTRVAVGIRDQQSDMWIGDFTRKTLTRLTFGPASDQAPVWMPDGKRLVWASQTGTSIPNIFMQNADGAGPMLQLTSSALPLFSTSVTSDGRRLILWENNPKTTQDIVTLDVSESSAAGTRRVEPLIHTSAAEVDGEISPDGRWLAYQSNESGQPEVFVRPFPGVDAARWQVSSGGTRPAWARNGQELFYLDGQGLLTSVPLRIAGSSFSAGNPVRLLTTKYYPGFTGLGIDLRGYDVSQDGQRFLMIKDAPVEQSPSSPPASIVLVLNWFEELKARLPVK